MTKKKRKRKSRSRLYNPHDGSHRPAQQVHKDKTKYTRRKKHKNDYEH